MRGAILPLPNTPSWRGAQLKHEDNFTFTFHLFSPLSKVTLKAYQTEPKSKYLDNI